MGQRARIWVGVPDRQRGHADAQGTHERACACESWGCYMCACTSDLLSSPVPEEEETWLAAFMCDVSPVRIFCDSLCGWPCQCPLYVCVCLCPVSVRDMCLTLPLAEPANGIAAAASLRSQVPRNRAGLQWLGRRVTGQRCWSLQLLLTFFNNAKGV